MTYIVINPRNLFFRVKDAVGLKVHGLQGGAMNRMLKKCDNEFFIIHQIQILLSSAILHALPLKAGKSYEVRLSYNL